jgi:hypothetical protein|tara:strand:- start:865 stop:1122 length:258 start_codon:yes stop_codon:yes gene_type:complete
MSDKFWDREEVEGRYMEVILSDEDGEEFIYWVDLKKNQEDEDEYDWSIDVAVAFHNKQNKVSLKEDHAVALEPFSRNESEFTFVD